jgi:thiol-disulfide isomerase/thioredoxin
MKSLLLSIALALLVHTSKSQDELGIGDRLPDIEVQSIMKFSTSSVKLSDLRGKIIILDFWTTWCGSCIASMPKLAALQRKYHDKLQIFLVTPEDSSKIERIYKRLPYLRDVRLPIVLKDSVLSKLFPHRSVPHVVWINGNQDIAAISEGEYLIDKTLDSFIQTGKVSLPLKKEIPFNSFDIDESICKFIKSEKQVLFSSILIKGIDGLPARAGIKLFEDGRVIIQATNAMPISLYSLAYKRKISLSPNNFSNRILLNTRNAELFKVRNTHKEYTEASYCYELILPRLNDVYNEDDYLGYMRKDLDRFFKINTKVEKRSIPCYIIEPCEIISKSVAGTASIREDSTYIEIINHPPQKIITVLSAYCQLPHPPFYEGPSQMKFSLRIEKKMINIDEVEKLLISCGLRWSVQNRDVDVLCVTDQ